MSRYNKEHYEDMALFIKELPSPGSTPPPVKAIEVVKRRIAERLADRFAADNPPTCIHCGRSGDEATGLCLGPQDYLNHEVGGGFNREQFLAACGLKMEEKVEHGL